MNFAVVGTFDNKGGSPSKIGSELAMLLGWSHLNGGPTELLNLDPALLDVLLWMPNVPNDLPKILPRLKAKNRKLILISSKRCGIKYRDNDVVGRLLKSRSNLGMAIYEKAGRFSFKLLDPLGNCFCDTEHLSELARAITARVDELRTFTRLPSRRVGPHHNREVSSDFIRIVHEYGRTFAFHVNALNVNRFLGNAATRCSFGFPAVRGREDAVCLVSRRDVSKDTIGSSDFVEVMEQGGVVHYWGENKPSVDAPIQVALFKRYPKIEYMIHGHVYVEGAPITDRKYPCGAYQEVYAVSKRFSPNRTQFTINLRGHGCLIACHDLDYLEKQLPKLVSRPFPEP